MFNIVMTARAQHNVEVIYDYIAERNREGANRWLSAFIQARDELKDNPYRYGLVIESQHLPSEVREHFFRTRRGLRYRMMFTISAENVFILRVRGYGQDLITE